MIHIIAKQRTDCFAPSMSINNFLIEKKAKESGKFGQEFCEPNSDFITFLSGHTPLSNKRKL